VSRRTVNEGRGKRDEGCLHYLPNETKVLMVEWSSRSCVWQDDRPSIASWFSRGIAL